MTQPPPADRRLQPQGSADRPARWLLLAALLIGLTRFTRLGDWSLWLDEALTLADSLHGNGLGLKNPLGYALVRLQLGWIDGRPSEWDLRLLPALFGWLGIVLCYWAFAPFAGRRVAAGAALLLAVSSWHTYWSQTARFYTLAQDLSLLGSGLLLRGLWQNSAARVLAGLAVAGSACLAHLSGAFPLPALVLLPTLSRFLKAELPGARERTGRLLTWVGVIGLIAGATQVLEVWRAWQAIKGGPDPAHFLLTAGFYITPLLGVGLLIGSVLVLARSRRRPFECFALGVVVIVMIEAMVASWAARVSAQYVFVILPWVALLAALPLAATDRESQKERAPFLWAYLAVLALPALTTVGLYFSVRHGERPMWRQAYQYVRNHMQPDDLILGMDAPVGEYYLSTGNTDLRNQFHLSYLDSFRADLPDRWARFDRRTWFVLNREQLEDWDPADATRLRNTLSKTCQLMISYPLFVESRDLSVFVYLRK